MPAARHRSRSPAIAAAVIAMTGTCDPAASRSRSVRVAAYPSSTGICTSISTASKVSACQHVEGLGTVLGDLGPVARATSSSPVATSWFTGVVLDDEHARAARAVAASLGPARWAGPAPRRAARAGCRAGSSAGTGRSRNDRDPCLAQRGRGRPRGPSRSTIIATSS